MFVSSHSTTSTLSVGSTGSQARLIQSSHPPSTYQPVLLKDLGKSHSPLHDINVVKTFVENVRDDDQNISDKVMDKHLNDLQSDSFSRTNICDIAQYMANLKEKHMESEKLEITHTDQQSCFVNRIDNPQPSSDSTQISSEEEMCMVVIDTKVDKLFKSEKPKNDTQPRKSQKSPRSSISMSRSPDRNKSTSNSPIKIIKIKSPRNSVDSGKRLSINISRDNSKERSPDRYGSLSPRRSSEGGILKVFMPNSKPDPTLIASTSGILKRNNSPSSKTRSPDRTNIYRKSLSPGTSFESRSPDRNRLSPHGSFDRRSPDCSNQRYISRSPRGSFESRSPDRDRKRSLSAHSSFDKSKSPEPYYHYYYTNPAFGEEPYHSPERKGKRLSKSLERSSSRDSRDSNGPYRYGLSPERIYRIGPARSQSAEDSLSHSAEERHSNESLSKFMENPTCVECLYQRKPTVQQQQQQQQSQKVRGRQSRARKKVPRGTAQMHSSLERTVSIDKGDGCADCHEHFEIHV